MVIHRGFYTGDNTQGMLVTLEFLLVVSKVKVDP